MRVSIITPSYNQAAYLEETIRSVLNQDYPEIEYWVLDGGSNDGSVDIIRKYESALAGWVSEKDHGQADAVNKGFARASGDVVGWINSDDYYLPGAVRAAVDTLQANPDCGMAYADVLAINAGGEPINVMSYAQWGLEDLMQFRVIGQPSVFMRRSLIEKVGGLDASYAYLLDNHFWLGMLQYAPMKYVPATWAAARYHSAAKNLSGGGKYGAEAYRLIAWMQTQPKLAEYYQKNRTKIWAGAYCFDAHYLLDSGDARGALRAYLRALSTHPATALPHYRRIAFAFASQLVNIDALKARYLDQRKKRMAQKLVRH